MHALSHPFLLAGGVLLILIGFRLWRWSSRHDLKGLAVDAAWQVARNKGHIASVTDSDLAHRVKDLQAEGSNVGKAKKVAGVAARHFAAQIASLAGLVGMLAGAGLIGAAFYLK